jgi:hypothetical protein
VKFVERAVRVRERELMVRVRPLAEREVPVGGGRLLEQRAIGNRVVEPDHEVHRSLDRVEKLDAAPVE